MIDRLLCHHVREFILERREQLQVTFTASAIIGEDGWVIGRGSPKFHKCIREFRKKIIQEIRTLEKQLKEMT
jgi:predicted DNA-binding transcriptional regulator